jgi:hypothetical protein
MGEIANKLINGEMCAECGVYLEPKEKVYVQGTNKKINMPKNGEPAGIPVICKYCHNE